MFPFELSSLKGTIQKQFAVCVRWAYFGMGIRGLVLFSFFCLLCSIYLLTDSCTCTGLYFGIILQPKSFSQPSMGLLNLALIWSVLVIILERE